MADSTSWAPLVDGGQFRLLVTWGAERAKRYPNVPTLRESGFDIVSASPYGLAGPKSMDPGVGRVLHDAFKAALTDPAHLAVLERFDMPVIYMNSDDYRASVQRIIVEEGVVIRRLNLTIN
jgi:tripartite-type tricarboxylate transporter receptor subunit TctC